MDNPQNRIVHYVLNDGSCRPFLVTKAWNENIVNGTVFIDGSNDYGAVGIVSYPQEPLLTVWKTSIGYKDNSDKSVTSNTWHWPEKTE